MKKIFYSLLAVALCACAQSDVEDGTTPTPTPPQHENNSLIFTVVDNGFIDENGTRVTYGEYDSENNGAYKSKFDEDNAIGVFAIKSANMVYNDEYKGYEPDAYVVENLKLTLTDGVWKSDKAFDFKDADLLFAYSPYREDVKLNNGKPLFTGEQGSWAVSTGNNRFFVWDYSNTDNSTKKKFDAADWMGAAANITSTDKTVTFQMQHMRSMIELTTPKGVELTNLTLEVNGYKWKFTPYHFAQTTTAPEKDVYRILTTEYQYKNTLYATIRDGGIVKNYKKVFTEDKVGAGKCIRMKISKYTPTTHFEGGKGETLADFLKNHPDLTALRLSGSPTATDLNTLKTLANAEGSKLTMLDMYDSTLPNNALPGSFLEGNNTLTTLYLPNNLETIGSNSLQVKKVTNIDIPASVTTINTGAFYYASQLSVRIPNNSLLKTVGDGAFNHVAAVYTDENDKSMVVLPQSLENIQGGYGNAFGVPSLKKVVFKGTTAPEIANNAFTDAKYAFIDVPNNTYKGKFPGKTVYVNALPLTADNYKALSTSEGNMANLCDGINGVASSYWHSHYGGTQIYDKWGVYIDITLPTDKAYSNLKVFYANRGDGNNFYPKRVAIGVSDNGTDYTEVFRVESDLPENQYATKALDNAIVKADNSAYKYVRFAVLQSVNGTAETLTENNTTAVDEVLVTLSELMLAEDAWTDPAN